VRVVLAFVLIGALAAIAVEARRDAPTVVAAAAPPKPAVSKKKGVGRSVKPGASTLAAVKALPKAPKDELIKFVARKNPDLTGARLHSVHLFLKSQNLFTMEDMLGLGSDGIKALTVPDNIREQFLERMIKYIGASRKVDDGLMVPVPEGLKKRVPPKEEKDCPQSPRFLQVPVNNAAPSPVGDWLRRAYPHIKPLHMSRTILALQRQTIRTFTDLRAIAGEPPAFAGVDKLLYVPEGVREALREALIYHVGEEGYDDHKPVYVNSKPPLQPWPKHCSHGVAQYK